MVIHLIAAVFAAWRITYAISQGEKAGRPIRKWLAKERIDISTGISSYSDSLLAELIMCFKCLSFWAAIFCFVMIFIFPYFLYPFAISTVVIFLEGWYERG